MITGINERPAAAGGAPVRPDGNFLVFGAPAIGELEIQDVVDSLKSGWIGSGPKVEMFEKEFAGYKGSTEAVAVSSCTAGLHLSMLAAGIGKGDEVITTPMTFCATVNAIIHAGATPVLADCDLSTMNISPGEIQKKITPRTKAIVVVHFAGRCCDMDAIMGIADRHGLIVIEDCAHAIESEYKGKKAGTIGRAGCFSFYVNKNITTIEGGMVLTGDPEIASKIKVLRLHGMDKDAWRRFSSTGYRHYEVSYPGFKNNLTDVQAAIGIHQLRRIDAMLARRAQVWKTYNERFKDLPCVLPREGNGDDKFAYHLYTPLLDLERLSASRDEVLKALTMENIGTGVHYRPVHAYSYYRDAYGWRTGDYPIAEWIGERTISLPLSAALTEKDVDDVSRAFTKVMRYYRR